MRTIASLGLGTALGLTLISTAHAAEITFSCGSQQLEMRLCQQAADAWSAQSGHTVKVVRALERSNDRYFQYLDLLGRSDDEIDVLQIDVIWPSALAGNLVDLSSHVAPEVLGQHFETIVANNTVDGRLVAMPWFTDAGMLYYRKDLLDRYDLDVPQTYAELADAALIIQEGERSAGKPDFWGFVFEGQAYEGLTCNALEWISAHGGGRIVDEQGVVTVNNPAAVLALAQAASWVGTVAPERVTQFVEEDARLTFQRGNAAFMRNWPYAWALLEADDSPLKGKVAVAPLPKGGLHGQHSATLGGWQLAVSQHSDEQEAAIEFVKYLAGEAEQKRRAVEGAFAPTIKGLYDDPDVLAANPFFADLDEVLEGAVARPSSAAGAHYAQISTLFWEAAHATLNGYGTARDNLARLDSRLRTLQLRAGW